MTLPDSAMLSVRELRERDEPMLRRWFASLSLETRYQRFHGQVVELSPADWRYLTRIDQVDHVAILAFREGELAGVARMIRLSGEREFAEVSFVVGDDNQRQRVGSVLRDVLIARAKARGYRTLYAYVLPDNLAIRRLLRDNVIDRGGLLEVAV